MARSAIVAGEYVGIGSSLGRILTFTQFMDQTRRMALAGLLLLASMLGMDG